MKIKSYWKEKEKVGSGGKNKQKKETIEKYFVDVISFFHLLMTKRKVIRMKKERRKLTKRILEI